jgi:ABC-type multidrug transport system permease subunit
VRRSDAPEGEEENVEGTRRELPFVVMLASLFGFAKAAFLGFMGVIGLVSWNDVTEPWGIGALAFAALFAIASYALLRGSRAARMVLAALAVAGGVMALVYVFVGPTSAILPSLFTALLAAVLIWLLYGTQAAQEYFATA